MTGTKVLSLRETAKQEVTKKEKARVYQAMERVVHQPVARAAANEVIYNKVSYLSESQDFV